MYNFFRKEDFDKQAIFNNINQNNSTDVNKVNYLKKMKYCLQFFYFYQNIFILFIFFTY